MNSNKLDRIIELLERLVAAQPRDVEPALSSSQLRQKRYRERKRNALRNEPDTVTRDVTPVTPDPNHLTIDQWFNDVFWPAYPRREAKVSAAKAMRRAFKGVSSTMEDQLADEILSGLEKHKARWSDPNFIPLPASWINAQRWNDDLDAN